METKDCPYCHNPLQKGTVNAPQENFWFLPDGIKLPYLRTRWTVIEGGVLIRGFQLFKKKEMFNSFPKQEAYHCPNCKKIILDYSDEKELELDTDGFEGTF